LPSFGVSHFTFPERRIRLNLSIMLTLSLLAAILAMALVRERRLRQALETMVVTLFKDWRSQHAEIQKETMDDRGDTDDDRRL
jgi:hypothetical protein